MENQRVLLCVMALTVVVSGCISALDDEVNGEDPAIDQEEELPEENGDEATEDDVDRTVDITGFADNSYDTEEVEVEQGETVEFVYTHEGGQHDLVLENPDGEEAERTEVLTEVLTEEGDTDSFTYTFESDEDYTFFCDFSAHRAQGMEGTVTVN